MKKTFSLLISFMLLVNLFIGALADGEIVVTNKDNEEIKQTFEAGEEVLVTTDTENERHVPNGEYIIEGNNAAGIQVENQDTGLTVQNPDTTGDPLVIRSNVDVKAEGEGDIGPADGIFATGNVVVFENGDVEADGNAVNATNDALVIVNGSVTADVNGVITTDDAIVSVEGTVSSGDTGVRADHASVTVSSAEDADPALEKLSNVEKIDDFKDISTKENGTAVTADETGIRATNHAYVGVIGDVQVGSEKSNDTVGIHVGLEPEPVLQSLSKTENPTQTEETTNVVLVDGNVTVKANSENSAEAKAKGIYADFSNKSFVAVSGDVDVTAAGKSESTAVGIMSVETVSPIFVGGDVKATANGDAAEATGVYTATMTKEAAAHIGVAGDVVATGNAAAKSVEAGENPFTVNAVDANGPANIEIGGSAIALSENGKTDGVNGVFVNSVMFDTSVTVGKNVETLGTGIYAESQENGSALVHVGADVNGGTLDGETSEADTGVALYFGESSGNVNIIVEGTITAEDAIKIIVPDNNGEPAKKDAEIDTDKINIQVWKIEAGENVVESKDEELSKKVEENIQYILRVTQPTGGSIAVSGEGVNQFEKAINEKSAYTAKAGTDVIINLTVDPGYELTDVTGGTAVVTKTGDRTYSLVVPSLGGVDIQAIIRAIMESDSWERPAAVKATPVVPEASGTGAAAISAEDAATLSHYSPEQQVAIILTKIGMDDALASSGIRIKELARKAADGITSDLSSLVTEEELTIDGETAVWKVISLMENGKLVKYCFRQLEDGTWVFKKI